MPRRRKSDPTAEQLLITTSDGTRFRCSLAWIGREAEPRWVLLDASGTQYVGPVATDRTPEGAERDIESWWSSRETR